MAYAILSRRGLKRQRVVLEEKGKSFSNYVFTYTSLVKQEVDSLLACFPLLSEVIGEVAIPQNTLPQTKGGKGELFPLINLLNLLGLQAGLSGARGSKSFFFTKIFQGGFK